MKALVGAWDHRPSALLGELTALRSKVAELQRALVRAQQDLARIQQENEALRESLREEDKIEVPEVALSAS